MKKHCILLLSIMLPTWTLSACGTGTLKCESNDVPSVCDFTQDYVLNGDKCEVKKVDGCEIASFDTSNAPCFLCEKGKVLDSNSELCVDIDSENNVTNCFRYEKTSSDCVECVTDFFLSSGTCTAVGNIKVDNCSLYSSITQCQNCDSGYYLVENECVKIESLPNCRLHSNKKCNKCSSGYFLNLAYISNPPSTNVETYDLFATGSYDQISINLNDSTSTVCEKITVKNCDEHATANTCNKCEDQYFLTESKLCERYPETPISNCLKYSAVNKCKECASTHYVNKGSGASSDSCVEIPVIENCETYDLVNGFCTVCAAGFWLDTTQNSCVQRVFNPPLNCQEISPTSDTCVVCNTGFSLVTDNSGCLADIANCKSGSQTNVDNIEAGKHVCTECEITHYLVNQLCELRTVTGCMTYLDHKNACDECNHTHYINDAKDTCTLKSIPSCVTYSSDDLHECALCENLKYPNADACDDITNLTSCYKSDGVNDDCVECNADTFRTSAGVCTGARTATFYDSKCAGNSSDTDHGDCSSCQDGYVIATNTLSGFIITPVKTVAEMNTLNCLVIKSDDTGCNQCKDGFYADSAGLCTADPDPSTSLCVRMKSNSGATETLAAPGSNCEQCKDGYVIVSNACVVIEDPAYFLGCDTQNGDHCGLCESGFYSVDATYPFCAKETHTPSQFQTIISNCSVRLDFDKCKICDEDFVVNSGGTSCDSVPGTDALIKNTFDLTLNQQGSLSTTLVPNCSEYTQVTDTVVKCTKCISGFVGIVDNAYLSPRVANFSVSNEIYNPLSACLTNSLMYKSAGPVDHVGQNDCLIATQLTGSNGYGCIRCVSGKIGSTMEVTLDSDGTTALTTPVKVIGNCTDDSSLGLASDYTGFGLLDVQVTNINLSSYTSYSNCSDATKVVFYMFQWSAAAGVTLEVSSNSGTANNIAFCGVEADVLNVLTQKVDNCAAYSFGVSVLTTFDQSSTKIPTVTCLSCKPGFYVASVDSNGGAATCSPIHGCNSAGVSANNTWLNGCSHPDSGGWKSKKVNNVYDILYHDPMPDYAPYFIENCLLLSQEEKICVICKPGYTPLDSTCVAITSDNSNCSSPSMGYTQLENDTSYFTTDLLKSHRYASFAYIRQYHSLASNFSSMTNSFCQTCDSGCLLYTSPSPRDGLLSRMPSSA